MRVGPDIVTGDVVLGLDAGSNKSYPGSGTTWFDLTSTGANGVLSNVTYSSNYGGVFQFAGNTSSYIDISGINMTSTNYTVFAAARYTGSTRGRIVSGRSNNWLLGHWSDTTENYFASGWVSSVDNGATDTNWRIYHGMGHISNDQYSHYVNNTQITNNSTGGSQGPDGFTLGKYGPGNSEPTQGEIAFLIVYNRVLTSAEVTQNFEAVRGRFGL